MHLGIEGSTFEDCDFSRVRIRSGSFDASRTSSFVRYSFDGLRPGATSWGVSRFVDCSFRDMDVKDWFLPAAEFISCRFSGRFDGIVLFGTPQAPYDKPDRLSPWRTSNEFRGNDFSGADLRFPDLRFGVDVGANTWPSGPGYLLLDRWPERLLRALAEVGRWENEAARTLGLWWLRKEGEAGRDRQVETLIRTTDWDAEPRAAWPKLWESLAASLD